MMQLEELLTIVQNISTDSTIHVYFLKQLFIKHMAPILILHYQTTFEINMRKQMRQMKKVTKVTKFHKMKVVRELRFLQKYQ